MAGAVRNKQTTVRELMQRLQDDNSSRALSNGERQEILEKLKVHGRDPTGADAIYCTSGIEILCRYAFMDSAPEVSREALRCLANALLLQPQLRNTFVDAGHATSIAKVYQQQTDDDEFLAARILFLLTYGTSADFPDLIASQRLTESIQKHLARHATSMSEERSGVEPMATMSWSETLKLVYNVLNSFPSEGAALSIIIPSIWTILAHTTIPAKPLDMPLNTIINALAALDFETLSTPSADLDSMKQYMDILPRLVEILQVSIKAYTPLQLDTLAISLVTVLRMIYSVTASQVHREMQRLLLPDDSERDLPLGKSSSLASQLLQLTVSPGLTNLPEAISSLMFEMSEKDASLFVRNIGYGYAAGYLMTHKIPIPENAKKIQTGIGPDEVPINPITGQRLDKEPVADLPEMTQEEKEQEAERLFVLFGRLQATGVVDVKNPVRQAMEEGRLTEADSGSD